MLSPHDPDILYQAGNRVFRSADEGQTWEPISPISPMPTRRNSARPASSPRTTAAPSTTAPSSRWPSRRLRPATSGPEPTTARIHLTRDGGQTWTEITPANLPRWATVRMIDASPARPAPPTSRPRPASWTTSGPTCGGRGISALAGSGWTRAWTRTSTVHVLREDPGRRGLLLARYGLGLLVSLDDGANWQRCRGSLPRVPVHDFVFKGDDLVVATHGRSIWILEDLPALRQHRPELDSVPLHLYEPRRQIRWVTDRGFPSKSEARRSYALLGPVVVAYDKEQLPGRTESEEVRPAGTPPTVWRSCTSFMTPATPSCG